MQLPSAWNCDFFASLWSGLVSCVLKPVTVIDSTMPRPSPLLFPLFSIVPSMKSIFWPSLVPEFIFEMCLYREMNPLSVHAFHNQRFVLRVVFMTNKSIKKIIRQSKRVNGELFYASVSIRHVSIVAHRCIELILSLYGYNLKLFLV